MSSFDVLIIGGGPIGIACGLEAKKRGLTYAIVEKGPIVNSLFNYPINMQFFSSSEKLEIDEIPFISKEAKPKRNEALEYYRRIVTSNELNIKLFEQVHSVVKSETGTFDIETSKNQYTAGNVIVATGFYDIPNTIKVKGEDLPKVSHYYKDPHFYASQKLAVVGASNSAIDAALECWRKGAEVTLIIRGHEVGQRVVVETQSETDELDNDNVLALTGYRHNFKFLESLGVKLSEDGKKLPAYNPDTMETNVNGMYLAGVICGGMETHKWFIENSRIHAPIIMDAIQQKMGIAVS